jgi:hypothetical protein
MSDVARDCAPAFQKAGSVGYVEIGVLQQPTF